MTIGIVANLEKRTVNKIVPSFLDWLEKRGIDFFVEENAAAKLQAHELQARALDSQSLCQRCELIVSFGGDGTILSTARLVGRSGIPILGVKIGGMGFLAEVTPEELYNSMENILRGEFQFVERMVLEAEVGLNDDTARYYALNDIVIDKGAVSRVIRVKTFVDDEFLNIYIGDGLIISTPTGSTAYSLASGGPILLPTMEAIIINPICPHTLSARPVVIPGDKAVRVEVVSAPEAVMLSADGQVNRSLQTGEQVVIRQGDYRIKLITDGGRTFYDVLHAKLNWGEDIRKSDE